MQVIVDGLLTHYELSGKGKVVVLLHGWVKGPTGMGTLPAQLARYFTVIALDLPGFGRTGAPARAWDLTDYARFVSTFLRKIDARDVYAFVGHSNGGAIALRGLARDILSADRLVLLASAGVRGSYNTRSKAARLVVKAGKLLAVPLPARARRAVRRSVYGMLGSDMFVAEHLEETFKKVVADDVQADAAHITVPVLLLYGERDEATPVLYGEMFHQLISHSTLEIIPGAGHFVFQDRPEVVFRAIRGFLR